MSQDIQLLKEYKTSHMPLVAYLKMSNCVLSEVMADGKRGIFVFSCVPRQLLIDFNAGRATVEPNEFAEKMSQMTHTAKRAVQIGE